MPIYSTGDLSQDRHHLPLSMSSGSKRLILFLLSSVFYTSLSSSYALFSSSSCSSSPFPPFCSSSLTSPTMLTIRYLQLWNPLLQCQSGQPHRWVQRCPLQEVRGSDRLSGGGRCAWGGTTEHHSMTYDPKASQLTSTPVAIHALNCRHQGLMETPFGLTKAHLKPEREHICHRLQRN